MSLDNYRTEIDRIDREIIRLLQERQAFVTKIGEAKKATGTGFYAPDREEALLSKLENIAPDALPKPSIRAIYREIISLSIGAQMTLPIAYLGPEGTYTQQATLKNFGSSVPLTPLRTIPDVFAAVNQGEAAYGVIPIENSTEGAIVHSLDMLAESELKIVAQIYLSIEHCLIGRGPLKGVKRILSKDIALAQCRSWLQRHLPDVEQIATDSTAAAVRAAAEDATTAAVASGVAATLYDVPVLAQGIQDKKDNITRFLVIGTKANPPSKSCEDKTSLVLSLKHEPGTLQKALQPISKHGLNLTRIESRPSRRKAWEYLFFIDFVGHWEDAKVQAAVTELRDSCDFVKWLGSYPNVPN
ncbi:MAG: prephenate dehydratase [Puniceicoccales bacterium]|jgi:chorismate mutase/prephenate dehydratase|nr:prephenate dehydratase [Puniceicoccales bacterium]